MNAQKNIEAAIREGEKNLSIQPSGQAWRKLERRLEARRQPQKNNLVVMRRWLAVAATLLVLVVSLFTFSTEDQVARYDFTPTFVEEINGENDCSPYCMNIEARKILPAFYTVPGKEG
ncbi:MAG: hypothetical protein AAFZ15_05380 [Bacteroidota bacterium]